VSGFVQFWRGLNVSAPALDTNVFPTQRSVRIGVHVTMGAVRQSARSARHCIWRGSCAVWPTDWQTTAVWIISNVS
jgi:hypothetical protein